MNGPYGTTGDSAHRALAISRNAGMGRAPSDARSPSTLIRHWTTKGFPLTRHRPPIASPLARRRRSTRPEPSMTGRDCIRRMGPVASQPISPHSGPGPRLSTAHSSGSSCFYEPALALHSAGMPRASWACRRGARPLSQAKPPSSHRVFGGSLRSDIGLDHLHPGLVRTGGVELKLEAVHHIRLNIGDIDVELFVPST